MKLYKGWIDADKICHVTVRESGRPGRKLGMRFDLVSRQSPANYDWGYTGPGPAQLALALLADVLDDDLRAMRLAPTFEHKVVANLPQHKPWEASDELIRMIARDIEAEQKQ